MDAPALPPDVLRLIEEPRPLEEFLARTSAPPTNEELETTRELTRWFTTRYPTVQARLAYVRRAMARWRRSLPVAVSSGSTPSPDAPP
jgi:hypothetical protein